MAETINLEGTQTITKTSPKVEVKEYIINSGNSENITLTNSTGKTITVRVTIESQDAE